VAPLRRHNFYEEGVVIQKSTIVVQLDRNQRCAGFFILALFEVIAASGEAICLSNSFWISVDQNSIAI